MRFQALCDGVPIGTAELSPPEGLAHAPLTSAPGYAIAEDAARDAALAIATTSHWSAVDGDFAEEFARRWTGGRLALADEHGVELAVASVLVMERDLRRPWLVADFRPDLARIEALLRTLDGDGGGRSRPAA